MALRLGKEKSCRLLPDQQLSRTLPQDWDVMVHAIDRKSTADPTATDGVGLTLLHLSPCKHLYCLRPKQELASEKLHYLFE